MKIDQIIENLKIQKVQILPFSDLEKMRLKYQGLCRIVKIANEGLRQS